MRMLLIDNHDSFTFNLHQLMAAVNGEPPVVVPNDAAGWDELAGQFDGIVISPGPGRPEVAGDVGVSRDAIERADVPLLGVCLGHQAIAWASGGRVVRGEPVHGRTCAVEHAGGALFEGIPQGFAAMRYHSLVVDPALPDELEPIAWSEGVLMGLRHRRRPLWGVQFHPESVGSEHGHRLLANFRDLAALARRTRSIRRAGAPATEPRTARSVMPGGRVRPPGRASVSLVWRRIDPWIEPARVHAERLAGREWTFWLDSSLVGAVGAGARFSFLGDDRGPLSARIQHDIRAGTDLFAELRAALDARRVFDPDLPFDFQTGFVGYLGYEVKAACGAAAGHPAPLPDAQLLYADRVLAFDHVDRAVYLLALADEEVAEAGRADAAAWIEETAAALAALAAADPPADDIGPAGPPVRFALDRGRERYLADVRACLEEIRAGESYEVCLTDQLRAAVSVDPARLHGALRRRSPAPYAALLCFPGAAAVCSSPERFLRIDRAGQVESRPIKGTRPRGATPAEDAALAADLASSAKDRAENIMIVDLVRNDLGVVCEPSSVQVAAMMEVETYAGVHQLVSAVRGRLRGDVDALDCVRAAFPPGSMTGAPKRRTLAILDRLEGAARGIYSGAIGYLSASGAADLAVVIRTAVVRRGEVTIGVGGAVVAMSDPAAELDEILVKGRALVAATADALDPIG